MKRIAIIGGSYLQLPAVRKAQELGCEVHCFSWEAGAVCRKVADHFYPISVTEKDRILEVCRDIGISGVTSIASDVAVPTVNYVAQALGLVGNPVQYSAITTNKYRMRESFAEHGIPSPLFARCQGQNIPSLSGFRWPIIVKPTDRSGSLGVMKVTAPAQIGSAVERACRAAFSNEAIVEEFVPGLEISVESISWEGHHHILAITDKVTTGEPFFVELEHHEPSTLGSEIQSRVRSIVVDALNALHIRFGAAHSELKITADGDVRVIEIGARMGGDFIGSDLVLLSTGYDFLKGVIEVALGEFTSPTLASQHCSGVFFLSKETEYLKPIIQEPSRFREIVRAEITDPELRGIQSSGDRSGYLIYQSNERLSFAS